MTRIALLGNKAWSNHLVDSFKCLRRLLALWILLTISIQVAANTVAPLTVLKNGKPVQSGIGALIAPETLLINYRLINLGDLYQVTDPESGAVLLGSLLQASDDADMALITVKGLRGTPFTVAKDPLEPGRKVSLLLAANNVKDGTLHSIIEPDRKSDYPRVAHTAVVAEGEFGAPLVNNCGELAGVSQNNRKSLLDPRLALWPDFSRASHLNVLTSFLDQAGVPFQQAEQSCLSVKQQLEKAEQDKLDKNKALDELSKKQAEIEAQKKALEARSKELEQKTKQQKSDLEAEIERNELAEEKQRELEQAKAETEQKKQALEKQAAEAEEKSKQQQQQKIWIGAGLGIVLLLVILAAIILIQQKKKRLSDTARKASEEQHLREKVQQELDAERVEFNDILLIGNDEDGTEHRVRVNGKALAKSPQGQILGRSAQHANYVVNLEQISRQHLRLIVLDNHLMVEDLQSFNGSAINGQELVPGTQKILANGDELRVGTVNFAVHFFDKQ